MIPLFSDQTVSEVALTQDADKVKVIRFKGRPGLYELSVIADGREFDWESLYEPMDLFGNEGQRTGPWDFSVHHGNTPLVPSYRVKIDGVPIGLWFFQRISLDDLEGKRFRGRMGFWIESEGCHELELTPYRDVKVDWISANLGADSENSLEDFSPRESSPSERLAAQWRSGGYWQERRRKTETCCDLYRDSLRKARDWVIDKRNPKPEKVTCCLILWRLFGDEMALEAGLGHLRHLLELPAWGNPNPDGYSHNGDMAAAACFQALARAWRLLDGTGREELQSLIVEKLRLHGAIFIRLALLNRDYWGGSILQDHGWQSMFCFSEGALWMEDVFPEARKWLSYLLPRCRKALEAMPRDGVVPLSSYAFLYLYVDPVVFYRELLKESTGIDLYEAYPFREIVRYVEATLNTATSEMEVTTIAGNSTAFIGGISFFSQLAKTFCDRRAAGLVKRLLHSPEREFFHSSQRKGYYCGLIEGFLFLGSEVEPDFDTPADRSLFYFEDSGLVHYRDEAFKVSASIRCGPFIGFHAYRKASGPCDRMAVTLGQGHFSVAVNGRPLLVTPESGYRIKSFLQSCLLVNDRGQSGDIGYPMSIPSKAHAGEGIDFVKWDDRALTGHAVLELTPAYAKEEGLVSYTRTFLFRGDHVVCRDNVVLDSPKKLSWLFHGRRENGLKLGEESVAHFGDASNWLSIQPIPQGCVLSASIHETEVVWGYASATGRLPFDHVRFDTVKPARAVQVDFVVEFGTGRSR